MIRNVQFYSEATKTTTTNDCLLFVAISGTKETIRERLLEMVDQIDSAYGKPYQGCISACRWTIHVITPIWNGDTY